MARLSYLNQELHLGEILQILWQQMPELCNRYKVGALGVFGSYLRGEADEKRGLDLLVDMEVRSLPLLQFIALENHLSDLLGLMGDLVEMSALKPALGRRILEDVDPVHRDHYYEYSGRGRPGRKITGSYTRKPSSGPPCTP